MERYRVGRYEVHYHPNLNGWTCHCKVALKGMPCVHINEIAQAKKRLNDLWPENPKEGE